MKKSELDFIATLQKKAKEQSRLEASSPLPEWIRPTGAVIGSRFWLFLFIFSGLVAVLMSTATFAIIYNQTTGVEFEQGKVGLYK